MKASRLNRAVDQGREDAFAHEDALASAYGEAIAQAGRIAASRFAEVAGALTAAAPSKRSAMVAVYPTAEQAQALALPNGEPAEILHVTLAFLGELDPDQAEAAAAVVAQVAREFVGGPLEGIVGGRAAFGSDTGMWAEIARVAGLVAPDGGYGETLWNFPERAVYWVPADWTTDAEAEAAAQAFLGVPGVESVVALEAESAPPSGDDWLLLWAAGEPRVEASFPSIVLPDVPGLAELRQGVTEALSDAGIPYAENHGWTPHLTLDYVSEPDPPPADLLGLPLTFENLSFTQGDVARDFPLGQDAVVAAGPPDWHVPHPDEVVDVDEILSKLRTKADPVRQAAIKAATLPALDAAHIDFDATNPFVASVLEKTGAEVVGIAETTRLNILRIIRDGYEQGLTVPDTAKAIREGMAAADAGRAKVIARTELNSLAAGGSVAATQIVAEATGTAYWKTWRTAPGAPNPRHEEYDDLDGQTVALDDFFDVGGARMAYPGDPDGPPEESIQCRCVLTYSERGDLPEEADVVSDLSETVDELAAIDVPPIVGDTTAELASTVVARAAAVEPKLTEIMRHVVEPSGGHLEGISFRLKTEASMARKIKLIANDAGIPEQAAAKAMKDGVRYTAVYGPRDFAAKARSTLDQLKRAGLTPETIRSRWAKGEPYVGLNVILRAPNGVRAELQIHTPESLRTKQVLNHPLYEKWRTLEPGTVEGKRLEEQMVKNSDAVTRPKGVESWTYEPSVEADIGITPFRTGDDPIGFYDSAKFQRFERDIQESAKAYGVEVDEQRRVAGVWEGSEEPAVALRIHDGELGVRAFAANLGKAYEQDGVLLFTAKTGEDVVARFGATTQTAAPLERIGALPRLVDTETATSEQLAAAAQRKGLPGDIALRLHESQQVPKSLILNDRYDVRIEKTGAEAPQPEYQLRFAPHPADGVESFEGQGRDKLRTFYDSELAEARPHPLLEDPNLTDEERRLFEGRQTVKLKDGTGYRTWEEMKADYPNWDSASDEFVWRGMSAEEMAEVIRTGEIKSFGAYNIGEEQVGLTFFGTDGSIASSYASSYAPVSMKATFDRPAFIVKVRRPPEDQLVLNPRLENEVGVKGSVPADQIVEVIEVRPYEVQEGILDLKPADPYNPSSPYAQAGGNGGQGSYVYRSLGPLAGEVDREQVFAAMADAGLPAGRLLPDGRLEVIGSGPEFVKQLDTLAASLRTGYDADVGEFRLLERANGDYETALRDFGGAPGEQVRAAERAAPEGNRGRAAVREGARGDEAGARQVGVPPPPPNVAAAQTLPQPAVPPVPEPLTPAQIQRLSVDGLWKQASEYGKIENIARAEIADRAQTPVFEALWKRGEGRPKKGRVRYSDLAGDQQVHSVFSDGHQTILEMAEAARARGQRRLVISDHSHLLTAKDIEEQHRQIDFANAHFKAEGQDFKVVKGIEVNILADGTLDTPLEVLQNFDVVNAAIHAPQKGEQLALFAETNTDRMVKAMESPAVRVLVHPHSVDANWDTVARKAAERNVALEINGRDLLRNDRQEAAAKMIEAALRHDAKLVIGSDSHTSGDLVDILYAVRFAAQHGVTPEDLLPAQRLFQDAADALPDSFSLAVKTPTGNAWASEVGDGTIKPLGGGMAKVFRAELDDRTVVVKIPKTQDELEMEFGAGSDLGSAATGVRLRENIDPGYDLARERGAYAVSKIFNEVGGKDFHVYTPAVRDAKVVVPAGPGRVVEGEGQGVQRVSAAVRYAKTETVDAGIQEFVPGEIAIYHSTPWQSWAAVSPSRREEVRSAALFDAIIGNTDRHGGNFLIGTDDHLWLIDHGLSFPSFAAPGQFSNDEIVNFAASEFKRKLTAREVAFLERFLSRWDELENELAIAGVPAADVAEMKARVEGMLARRDRRPWPHGSDLHEPDDDYSLPVEPSGPYIGE